MQREQLPSEDLLRAILKVSSDVLCIVDGEGRIREAADAFCALLGRSREEILKMSLREIFPAAPAGGTSLRGMTFSGALHLARDAGGVETEISITPVSADGSSFFLVVVRKLETNRENRIKPLALDALLKLYGQKSSRCDYLDAVVDLIGKWTDCCCVGLRGVDEDDCIPYEAHRGFCEEFLREESWLSTAKDQCACIRVVLERPDPRDCPFVTPFGSFRCGNLIQFIGGLNEAESARFRGACLRYGFLSLAIVPVRYREKMVGVIHIADERPCRVPAEIVEFLESIAPLIGEAIHKFNVEQTLQRNHATQTIVNSLLRVSMEDVALEDLLDLALDEILRGPPVPFASGGCIAIFHNDSEMLTVVASKGAGAVRARAADRVSLGSIGCADLARGPQIRMADSRIFGDDEGAAVPCYCVPILSGEKSLGAMFLNVWEGQRHRRRSEEEFLTAIANALAGIIIRKRAEMAMMESQTRYRAIVEDQTELISRSLPDGTLSFVNEAYCRYFGETREELVGRSFWHHIPRGDRQLLRDHVASLTPENPVATVEHRVITKSGEVHWQFWTDRGIFDSKGTLVEIQCVGRDVTRRKRAETALRESGDRLRRLSAELLLAQEKERKRIANELHDGISQSLTAIKFMAEKTLSLTGREDAPSGNGHLSHMVERIQQTIEEVRRIMTDLRPSILDDIGIVATIGWFCREFREVYSGIRVEERICIEEEDVPDALKIVLFRTLQEAMNNVVKHSKADFVSVSLAKNDDKIELAVRDNGEGFDVKNKLSARSEARGLGLGSMRERAELSGGSLSIKSRKGRGTLVRGLWPCASGRSPGEDE